MQTKNNIVKN